MESNMGSKTIANTIKIRAGNIFFMYKFLKWNILTINSNFTLF